MKYMNQIKLLTNLLREISDSQIKHTVVFDLDSTLFNVTPRIEKIFNDFFIKNESLKSLFYPVQLNHSHYHYDDHAKFIGILPQSQIFSDLKEFWSKSFFSNDYLQFDEPYPGAQEFLKNLSQLKNVEIIYLTGRDKERMYKGTFTQLTENSFPIPGINVKLVMKPNWQIPDTEFKLSIFNEIEKNCILFENEPTVINNIYKNHPNVRVVFFDSNHSGKELPPKDVPSISHFT